MHKMPRTDAQPIKTPRFVILAAICVIVAALYFAREVLVPLALAMLLSFLLAPLVTWLERRRLPRALAVATVVSLLFSVLAILTWVVAIQVEDLAQRLPQYKDNIIEKVRAVRGGNDGALGKAAKTIEEVKQAVDHPTTQSTEAAQNTEAAAPLPPPPTELHAGPVASTQPVVVRVVAEPAPPLQTLGTYLGTAVDPLATAGIVLVFVIFMLLQREDLRDRLIRLVGEGQIHVTTTAFDDAAGRITRYLTAQAIVNGTYGLAISLGLWIIGMTLGGGWFPSFVLWGLLCGLLRFIPYIGPWIGAAFPLTVAFAVYPGYSVFVATVALFVVIELISNSLMEPWLYGASTGMSTVAILVAAVFWTWLWGPIGLLLATPLTVCIVVIGKYVPQFAFLDVLLGDQPVLEPYQRLYQRLLATDQEEATSLAEQAIADQPLDQVYDQMVLPALALAEADRHSERLDERRGLFMRQAFRDIVDQLVDEERLKEVRRGADETLRLAKNEAAPSEPAADSAQHPPREKLPSDCPINIVCLPAHDEADEIVGIMLAQLLELRGYCAFAASHNALASEMLNEIEQRQAQIVCVSALPPSAVTHARYLCKRLHGRFPGINTVVGLWTVKGDLSKAKHRIACAGDVTLATNLAGAIEQITKFVQPLLLKNAPIPTPAEPRMAVAE